MVRAAIAPPFLFSLLVVSIFFFRYLASLIFGPAAHIEI